MTQCHALSLSFEFQLTRTNKKKASTRAPWQKTQAEDCDKACDQSSEFKVQRSCFSQVQIDCTSRASFWLFPELSLVLANKHNH